MSPVLKERLDSLLDILDIRITESHMACSQTGNNQRDPEPTHQIKGSTVLGVGSKAQISCNRLHRERLMPPALLGGWGPVLRDAQPSRSMLCSSNTLKEDTRNPKMTS